MEFWYWNLMGFGGLGMKFFVNSFKCIDYI